MLIKYEFLKIIRRKSTIIVMAISLLVTGLFFGLPAMQFQTMNQDGTIRGMAGIAYERERQESLSALLTEEYVTDIIREYQRLFENPDNVGYDGNEAFLIGDAYWNFEAPRTKLLRMIIGNYPNSGPLVDMDVTGGAAFYQARDAHIEGLLNSPSRGMSEQQQNFWRNMNDEVATPFQFGYYEGWDVISNSFELLMFAILAVCIVLAPVFAGEYQAGTDAVILAGKYGKTKLIRAKLIAAFSFGLLAFTLHALIAWGLPLLTFGVGGWNLPLQIANTLIPYPLTFLQAMLINLGVVYLVLLAMVGLTLLLSARMKTPYLVLLVLVPVLFIPLFLSPNGTTGLYNLTLYLLPYQAIIPRVGRFISYQIGGLVLDAFSMRAVLYAILTLITIPFAGIGFKKHQVLG